MYCFAKVCRLCLSHDSALIHCRARDKNNVPNYHKIKVLFPHLINKTSQHFPIWICNKCQEQVNQSYEFKQKCYKTYKLLRKYSVQLYAANKGNNIPDVPSELFQEVKPIIDNNVISIDEEDHSDNYYNADDITIVKNELLPGNMKHEPDYNNMIQSIIENNIETIRHIDDDPNTSVELKREIINTCDVYAQNREQLVQDNEAVPASQEYVPLPPDYVTPPPEDVPLPPEYVPLPRPAEVPPVADLPAQETDYTQTNNVATSVADQVNASNPLDVRAFTLDYTNASFETFASYVAPNVSVEPVPNPNSTPPNEESVSPPDLSCLSRVLRRRKSICYRTMERYSDTEDDKPTTEKVKKKTPVKSKRPVKPTKKETKKVNGLVSKQTILSSVELHSKTTTTTTTITKKHLLSKTQNAPVTRSFSLMARTGKKGVYACEKCFRSYVLYCRYVQHQSACKGKETYRCSDCYKVFASAASLRRHGTTHLVLSCEICHTQYTDRNAMRKHILTHRNLKLNKTNPFF